MKKRTLVLGVAAVVAAAGIAVTTRGFWYPGGAVAQAPRPPQTRAVSVEVAVAEKKPVPVRFEALGTVTPIQSVSVKTRVDSEIIGVHFRDGAMVKQGDILFTLDSRTIEAQIKQVQAQLEGAKAQVEQGERDVARYNELIAKNATTQVTLNNARTQVNIWRSAAESFAGQLENLNVQLTYCTIRAQISGRASSAAVKVGNFVRQADITPLATINQISPIYVTFALPQRHLPELRLALQEDTTSVDAIVAGESRRATGQVSVIENTVDMATGMVTVRATMPNREEVLWPGTLVTARLNLRIEQSVVVPSVAVQVSQAGTFVFVIKDGAAEVRPVKVARNFENLSVISEGLSGGETVVTDGHLQLAQGAKVTIRGGKQAGS